MSLKNGPPKEENLRIAADIVSDILKHLARPDISSPGRKLKELDELAGEMMKQAGATSYNKGYKPEWAKVPYPAIICASVNADVAHAPPGERILEEGDIVTYDIGIRYKNACGDAATTVGVGEISSRDERLLRYAKRSLQAGIKEIRAGQPIGEISKAIEKSATLNGFNIVKSLAGHHIGRKMHESPLIPHYYNPKDRHRFENKSTYEEILEAGRVVCLEPILTPGHGGTGGDATDGWTIFTLDDQKSAMYEDMILIKENSYEVLTSHLNEVG